jgi:hypothetical protein
MFLAIGLVLPIVTMHIPEIGTALSPMHIPVLFCGLICGWKYGAAVGFILPLMRSLIFAMPPLMPDAVTMAFEIAVYGLVIGLLYAKLPKNIGCLYASLIAAMIAGRIMWGCVSLALTLFYLPAQPITFMYVITRTVIMGIPGIVLQIILIPSVMVLLTKTGLVGDGRRKTVY